MDLSAGRQENDDSGPETAAALTAPDANDILNDDSNSFSPQCPEEYR
jgi:hypothetical protein